MSIKKGIKLKFAISLLVAFTVCSTTTINWYLSVQALKNTLTENYLENNYQYAKKITLNTNELLHNMQQQLGTLANILGHQAFNQSDLDDWRAANSGYLNSLFTTDANGVVQLMSPQAVPNNKNSVQPGTQIKSDLMTQALKNKKPFISDPYLAQTGNLMILISFPIFDETGNYKGVVDGTIYLDSDSSLKRVLNHHEFLDESSVFVVDRSGQIIYHPDSDRINESIADHPLVQNVIQGNSGSAQIINSRGTEYFSGYAYVEQTGWGIITQTPTSVIEEPLHNLTKKVIIQPLPLLLLILLLAWLFTNHLSKPLSKLARFSEEAIQSNKVTHSIHHLEIKSPIYEVRQLYKHIQKHFQLLNTQIQQDGLTGLANRRSFDLQIKEWIEQKTPFSLIMIDIDNFKNFNDVYGHLVGDDVLRFLASIMHNVSREDDLCYRYGGEEFVILLKDKDVEDAFALAERLRSTLAQTPSPAGQPITISLGVSSYQEKDQLPEDVIKRADSALYQSKREGKNRTTIRH
ncbi:GGDEF domain-containing protein [Bacillus sp. V3B]|uniref:sensor domain-containing diguanylate cyclase n=1 Tax=Bacillus sp. V3B TaxID=2804915 RepID=UPI00210E21BC|nr:sensor domain-containing diguanylate cyclase [Bacillus sp. V3B]MCQ6277090.1 GGDEF domain-containing protein [Bacillus sp. V3B]